MTRFGARALLTAAAAGVLLSAGGAAAQDFTVTGLAGLNLSSVSFRSSVASDTAPKPAPVFGIGAGWRVVSRLSFQGDVLYSRRTTEFDDVAVDTLTYLEVPLMMRVRIVEQPGWSVHATMGAVQAWLLTAEEEVGGDRLDIEPALRTSDLAPAVGVQVRLRRIVADVRYLHGINDLYSAGLVNGRQRTIQLLVGYQLVR